MVGAFSPARWPGFNTDHMRPGLASLGLGWPPLNVSERYPREGLSWTALTDKLPGVDLIAILREMLPVNQLDRSQRPERGVGPRRWILRRCPGGVAD